MNLMKGTINFFVTRNRWG